MFLAQQGFKTIHLCGKGSAHLVRGFTLHGAERVLHRLVKIVS